jgi:hypothetical protein
MGNVKMAKEIFEKAIFIVQRNLGKDHISNATILYNLAIILKEDGDLKMAKEYF